MYRVKTVFKKHKIHVVIKLGFFPSGIHEALSQEHPDLSSSGDERRGFITNTNLRRGNFTGLTAVGAAVEAAGQPGAEAQAGEVRVRLVKQVCRVLCALSYKVMQLCPREAFFIVLLNGLIRVHDDRYEDAQDDIDEEADEDIEIYATVVIHIAVRISYPGKRHVHVVPIDKRE